MPVPQQIAAAFGTIQMRSMRVGLYLRVSTGEQTVANQERELIDAARRHGWEIAATYRDEGISGAKGREKRPGFDRLCKAVVRREIDMVAAWSADRLGRSLQDLVGFLAELQASRCELYLHQQGLDTSTPAGWALFGMLSVFADFERAMIVERTKAELAQARAQGKLIGGPKVTPELETAVRASLSGGVGVCRTAMTLGCGVGTVQRIKAGMGAGAPAP
jgi:DNA invertase Pin-like site-specific DNA recombinase